MKKFRQISIVLLILTGLIINLVPAVAASANILPAQAFISGFIGHAQTMPLSCESRSAVDVAAFWGYSISESTFFNSLPSSDNPEVGFVGNVYGSWGQIPPNAYGVHAQPIANTLQSFGVPAVSQKGMTFNQLKTEISNGRPVIVWVVGHVWSGTPVEYTANDGAKVTVAAYEHSMVAIGYDENYVQLIDAGNGFLGSYEINSFKASWGVLGNLAVTVSGTSNASVITSDNNQSETPTLLSGDQYKVVSGDTLARIAQAFGINWVNLAAYNNISYPYTIYPGQILKIPSDGFVATETPTLTVTATATPTETPVETETPVVTETPLPDGTELYTVQSGDYLSKIGRVFSVNWKDIVELNDLEYPYVLTAGMQLLIPLAEAEETETPTPAVDPEETETPTEEPEVTETPTEEPTEEPVETETPTEEPDDDLPDTYTVTKGDYLLAIARQFNLDFHTLAALNEIEPPYVVYPGQELILK